MKRLSNRRGLKDHDVSAWAYTRANLPMGVASMPVKAGRHGTISEYYNHRCRCEACRKAVRVYTHAYRLRNPDRFRNAHLKNQYGITVEWYSTQFDNQKGVCAICGKSNTHRYRLAVDHDHQTGRVRALLCSICNQNLGWFERLQAQILMYCASHKGVS